VRCNVKRLLLAAKAEAARRYRFVHGSGQYEKAAGCPRQHKRRSGVGAG
jgi:hypothetical protein